MLIELNVEKLLTLKPFVSPSGDSILSDSIQFVKLSTYDYADICALIQNSPFLAVIEHYYKDAVKAFRCFGSYDAQAMLFEEVRAQDSFKEEFGDIEDFETFYTDCICEFGNPSVERIFHICGLDDKLNDFLVMYVHGSPFALINLDKKRFDEVLEDSNISFSEFTEKSNEYYSKILKNELNRAIILYSNEMHTYLVDSKNKFEEVLYSFVRITPQRVAKDMMRSVVNTYTMPDDELQKSVNDLQIIRDIGSGKVLPAIFLKDRVDSSTGVLENEFDKTFRKFVLELGNSGSIRKWGLRDAHDFKDSLLSIFQDEDSIEMTLNSTSSFEESLRNYKNSFESSDHSWIFKDSDSYSQNVADNFNTIVTLQKEQKYSFNTLSKLKHPSVDGMSANQFRFVEDKSTGITDSVKEDTLADSDNSSIAISSSDEIKENVSPCMSSKNVFSEKLRRIKKKSKRYLNNISDKFDHFMSHGGISGRIVKNILRNFEDSLFWRKLWVRKCKKYFANRINKVQKEYATQTFGGHSGSGEAYFDMAIHELVISKILKILEYYVLEWNTDIFENYCGVVVSSMSTAERVRYFLGTPKVVDNIVNDIISKKTPKAHIGEDFEMARTVNVISVANVCDSLNSYIRLQSKIENRLLEKIVSLDLRGPVVLKINDRGINLNNKIKWFRTKSKDFNQLEAIRGLCHKESLVLINVANNTMVSNDNDMIYFDRILLER